MNKIEVQYMLLEEIKSILLDKFHINLNINSKEVWNHFLKGNCSVFNLQMVNYELSNAQIIDFLFVREYKEPKPVWFSTFNIESWLYFLLKHEVISEGWIIVDDPIEE